MSDDIGALRAQYQALVAKVDDFFARVHERYRADMQCGSGCHDCCMVELSVTAVEADAIAAHLAGLAPAARQRIRERARAGAAGRCAALDEQGLCTIYPARPLVCRTHGVPLRLRDERSLPVIDACPRNFAAEGAAAVADDCVLDQQTLSTILLTIATLHARARGGDALQRTKVRELLAAAG